MVHNNKGTIMHVIFSPLNFMSIIINKYNPSYIVFGYDNYFGYKKKYAGF